MVATHEEKDIIVIYVDGFEGALEVDLVDKVEVYEEAVDIGGLRLVRVGPQVDIGSSSFGIVWCFLSSEWTVIQGG